MKKLSSLYELTQHLSVLYVEDDFALRQKAKSIFENLFYRTDIADDGRDGLEKYEIYRYEQSKPYDIVITDVKMPRMGGVELVREILKLEKKQKIIVISAHSERNDLIDFINLGVAKFIQKPFTTDQIISILSEISEEIFDDPTQFSVDFGDGLVWNILSKELFLNNESIKLSYNETIILNTLITNPNHIFSASQLFVLLEEENGEKEFSSDSIKSIIKRLRLKVPRNIIKNFYGVGYQLFSKG